jgi:glycosyltransferase involved in cell wall biosynthesis
MIEAMYFGVPVLTMDTDFMRHTLHDRDNSQGEIIIEGKTGYIFDAYSSLYEKVRDLYFKV